MMKLRKRKSNAGRPKMAEHEKQRYSRIAAYPRTHERIKRLAKEAGVEIIVYLDEIIPQ